VGHDADQRYGTFHSLGPKGKRCLSQRLTLRTAIKSGTYKSQATGWAKGLSVANMTGTALKWATESNAAVCTVVLPLGVDAVESGDLDGNYTTAAQPTVNLQIAKQGYR